MIMSDCVFCKIISKELSSKIVYEDAEIVAFHDVRPVAPIHVLVVPKDHIDSIVDVSDFSLVGRMCQVAVNLAKQLGVSENGFRIINNCGADGGQTISHLHLHLIAGREFRVMG